MAYTHDEPRASTAESLTDRLMSIETRLSNAIDHIDTMERKVRSPRPLEVTKGSGEAPAINLYDLISRIGRLSDEINERLYELKEGL